MEFERRKRVGTELNIAPLIDIVFLLLIFFMLSSHFVTQPGIKIILPTAVTGKLYSDDEISIFIASDHRLYLNEEEVNLERLPDELKLKLAEAEKKTVIIKADEKIDLGLAVKVMDIAKQAEAEGLVISTKAEEDARPQSD
ncbi:MAG: biopolymer transporter ExbD [Candidatus Omnitrophota bacterium]|nr:MAG: biopolymer transporter ExbD [Candidatus Omnitrophota bacterium]